MMMFVFNCEPATNGFVIARSLFRLFVVITEVTPK